MPESKWKFYDRLAVEARGRRLGDAIQIQPQVPAGHVLVAIMTKHSTLKVAVDVTDPSNFQEFFGCLRDARWYTMTLYLFTDEQAKKFRQYTLSGF